MFLSNKEVALNSHLHATARTPGNRPKHTQMSNPFALRDKPAQWLAAATVLAVVLWFVTSCVDAVNFEGDNKLDEEGKLTPAWAVSIFMLSLSTLAFLATLTCAAVSIYFTVKLNRVAPGNSAAAITAPSTPTAPGKGTD